MADPVETEIISKLTSHFEKVLLERDAIEIRKKYPLFFYVFERMQYLIMLIVGLYILYTLLEMPSANPAVLFLLSVISFALVLFATGSQAIAGFGDGRGGLMVGGGAALFALGVAALIAGYPGPLQTVFRSKPVPYLFEVSLCRVEANDASACDGKLVNIEEELKKPDSAVRKVMDSLHVTGTSGDSTFAFGAQKLSAGSMQFLVFARNSVRFSLGESEFQLVKREINIERQRIGCFVGVPVDDDSYLGASMLNWFWNFIAGPSSKLDKTGPKDDNNCGKHAATVTAIADDGVYHRRYSVIIPFYSTRLSEQLNGGVKNRNDYKISRDIEVGAKAQSRSPIDDNIVLE